MSSFDPQSILELKARISVRENARNEDFAQLQVWLEGSLSERMIAASIVLSHGVVPLQQVARAVIDQELPNFRQFNPFVTLLVIEALFSFDGRAIAASPIRDFLDKVICSGHPTSADAARILSKRGVPGEME